MVPKTSLSELNNYIRVFPVLAEYIFSPMIEPHALERLVPRLASPFSESKRAQARRSTFEVQSKRCFKMLQTFGGSHVSKATWSI